MKTIEINGETFEVLKLSTKRGKDIMRMCHSYWLKDWDDLYKNPSYEKRRARNYWDNFFSELNAVVRGYRGNYHNFSIYAQTDDKYFYITSANNYVICTE